MEEKRKRGRPKLTAEQKEERKAHKLTDLTGVEGIVAKIAAAKRQRELQQLEDSAPTAAETVDTEIVATPAPPPTQRELTKEEIFAIMARAAQKRREQMAPPVEVEGKEAGQHQSYIQIIPAEEYSVQDEPESKVPDFVTRDRIGWKPL